MSTELTRSDIQAMIAEMQVMEDIRKQRAPFLQPEEDVYKKATAAQLALVRNAGGELTSRIFEHVHENALSVTDEKLKRYGCSFIAGATVFLKGLKCPAEARELILILMAMSGGNTRQLFIITDDMIKEFSGLSKDTIIKKRKALKEWQFKENLAVIEIHEQPRQKGSVQFKPTQYRVPFSDHVTVFVREWREMFSAQIRSFSQDEGERPKELWSDMKREKEEIAFPEAFTIEKTIKIAERIKGDIPDAPIPPRPRYDTSNKTTFRKDIIATGETQILRSIIECRDEARRRGKSAYSWWSDFKPKIALALSQETPGFPDPEGD